VNEF
jgi:hypothetical protein